MSTTCRPSKRAGSDGRVIASYGGRAIACMRPNGSLPRAAASARGGSVNTANDPSPGIEPFGYSGTGKSVLLKCVLGLIRPDEGEILIDGEPWAGSTGDRLVVALPTGVHRLEVRKAGFEPYSGLVRVRPNGTTTLNVALSPVERR